MPDTATDADGVPVDIDEALYQQWRKEKQALDDQKTRFAAIDSELRQAITDANDDCDAVLKVDGQRVGKYAKAFRHTLDTTRLKKDLPDLVAQYTKRSSYWYLRIAAGDE